ncbi:MAG: hypothetical protein CO002_01260 [Candidatus Portnoybacteria bacterium CG_4_8_14_3_um_filter_44_10]|uniref:Pilus assembly protein PilO n=1 Tax=Candidatus Portnoybacteria bacterium CG_4_8_14_3_um_filter_44_10 TaxID=1974802 RepID=A0A2M7IGD6_9BACT|nr:MAG: hypothetical protein CO002_01260 [Candidatus Portnoybacteria bacterium CG_4_8_14_3_um_filter_44_10]
MRIKIIFAVVILLASIIAAWQYVFPLYGKIKTLKTEVGQKQETMQRLSVFAQKLETLKQQYAESEKSIERLYKILPATGSTADFLNNADYLSFQSGMILGAINFSKQAGKSASIVSFAEGGVPGAASQEAEATAVPEVISVDFSTTGTYESFKSFLSGVEKNLRLTDVQSISFAGKGEDANLFEFRISANIYYKE